MMAELKKSSVKSKVEAVLFSVGHKISLDYIIKLCRSTKEEAIAALNELKKEYDDKQSSLMIVEEGDFWKFTVRDHYTPIVRKIVAETELTKSVLETLAVIAFKYPILQSDLIKLRTNKAYDHLTELESAGYISRQKHGRTNLIKLTERFFKYFDLTEEKLKEQFRDFDSIARAIKEKEEEVEKIKEEQRKRAEDLKKEDEKIKQEIESLDEAEEEFKIPLETYAAKPKEIISEDFIKQENLFVEREKIGSLEVVEEEQQEKSGQTESEQIQDGVQKQLQENELVQTQQKEETKQLPQQEINPKTAQIENINKEAGIASEMEAKIDQRVEEILHPEKKSKKK